MEKGAIISTNGLHRYQLWRIWDTEKPCVFWLMHNPSTADEKEDDPTIRRIIQFSKDFGFGGLYVGNMSSFRATNPKDLNKISYGELLPFQGYESIIEMAKKCTLHILAHGVPVKKLKSQSMRVKYPNIPWHYLQLTKSGYPGHPLYLGSHKRPIAYNHFQP